MRKFDICSHNVFWDLLKDSKNSVYKKIVTHPGIHHSDETLAIALLNVLWIDAPIVRWVPSEEDLSDSNVIVIDVGMEHNIRSNNYDHHQDSELPAACSLVLDEFMEDGWQKDTLKKILFDGISDKDTWKNLHKKADRIIEKAVKVLAVAGRNNEFHHSIELYKRYIATILNNDIDGMRMLASLVGNEYRSVNRKYIDPIRRKINNAKKISVSEGDIICLDETISYAILDIVCDDSVVFVVMPNDRNPDETILISLQKDTFPIKQEANCNQNWIHSGKFFAKYKTKESAIEHAKSMIKN